MFWRWLTVDVWGWSTGHPWWSAAIAAPAALLLIALLYGWLHLDDIDPHVDVDADVEIETEDEAPELTYSLVQLTAMSPAGFEQACAELLARDGFLRARRIGGAGDLGADVIARAPDGSKIVFQCKQYARPVVSAQVQTFNGTARPEHGADPAAIVGLNAFTKPVEDFAARHDIALIGREALDRWAQGDHLSSLINMNRPAPDRMPTQ